MGSLVVPMNRLSGFRVYGLWGKGSGSQQPTKKSGGQHGFKKTQVSLHPEALTRLLKPTRVDCSVSPPLDAEVQNLLSL